MNPREICIYCDGEGRGPLWPENSCGFCIEGVPLDTVEDWDESWGRVFKFLEKFPTALSENDQDKIAELIDSLKEKYERDDQSN